MKSYFNISLFVFLACCSSKENKIQKLKIIPVTFTIDDIYKEKLVTDFVFDTYEQNLDSIKKEGRKIFLEGIDAFKNKKDPHEAIKLFKKSILQYPDSKTYYELGNALMDINFYSQAIEAYDIAIKLGVQPSAKLYLNAYQAKEKADFISKDRLEGEFNYFANHYLIEGFKKGVLDSISILQLHNYKILAEKPYFKELVNKYINQNKSSNELIVFSNNFPEKLSGFKKDENQVDFYSRENTINYDYSKFIPEMENVEFGRDVSHDFFYEAKVAQTTNYVALIYSSVGYSGEFMSPVQTVISTFDLSGNIISKKTFACSCTFDNIKTGEIIENKIVVKEQKRMWEKPITETRFEENKVIGYELIQTIEYEINEKGEILEKHLEDSNSLSASTK